MRYKTTQEPSPSLYNLEVGDRWIHPETGEESDWNGTAWGSTPEADPIETAPAPSKPAAPPAKPKAVAPKK